jgi:hypothetical protein
MGTGSREEDASKQGENSVPIGENRISDFDHRPVRDGWNGAADIL